MTYSGHVYPEITGDPTDPNNPITISGDQAYPGTYTSPEEEEEQLLASFQKQPDEDAEAYRLRVGQGKQKDESRDDYMRRMRIYMDNQGVDADMDAFVSREAAEVAAGTTVLPFIDLGVDAIGKLGPVGASINDTWDEKTQFSSEYTQNIRDVAGVIVPVVAGSMVAAPLAGMAAKGAGGGAIAQGLARMGATAGVDMAVVGISDYSERDEGIMNALDGFLDSMGNPLGMNIPEAMQVLDDDDPTVRRVKLMAEAGVFSIVGDSLGYFLHKGLKWFTPKDEAAVSFKKKMRAENPDPDSAFVASKLDDQIEENIEALDVVSKEKEISVELAENLQEMLAERGKNLTDEVTEVVNNSAEKNLSFKKATEKLLAEDVVIMQTQKSQIISDVGTKGFSDATIDPLESYVARQNASRDWQTADSGAKKILDDPWDDTFHPDVQPGLADPSSTAARFSIPPGNVARNAADIAAEKVKFVVPENGVPTPMLSEPMMRDGLGANNDTRDIVVKITQEKETAGQYVSEIRKTKISNADEEEAGFILLKEILAADDVEEVKRIILPRKRSQSYVAGGEEIASLTPADAPIVGRAMRELVQTYLGPEVQQTSARLLHTTSKELDAISEAMSKFRDGVDPARITEVAIDKITMLAGEYGLQKYLWGWQGQNLKWWERIAKGIKKPEELVEQLSEYRIKNKASTSKLNTDLKKLMQDNPAAAYNLAMAYDLTGGKVADQVALTKWFQKQINLKSMLVNLEDDPTILAGIARAIRFNNVLSGLSAARAFVGNAAALVLKPAEYMLGTGMMGLVDGNFKDIRRGFYAYASLDNQGAALTNAYEMWKRANKDPQSVMKAYRADYQYTDDAKWELLDRMEEQYLKEGKTGDAFLIRKMRQGRDLALSPWMRWGTNAMLAIDTYTNTLVATANSKFRAFDEITNAGRQVDAASLQNAWKKHYNNAFDPDGVIKDEWLRYTSGEITLNNDNGMAQALTTLTQKVPGLLPFMMFPRSGINYIRKRLNYTPVQALVPSRTQKMLLAGGDDAKIREALLEYGIDATKEPQYHMIYKNIKAEYLGRMAMGATLMGGLYHSALAGNIRGNIPPQKQDQKFWRANNIQPKTIKVGGNWVSYDGIPPFDPILTFIGDIAYHQRDISESALESWHGKMLFTIAESFVSSTPLSGLDTLVALANPSSDGSAAWSRFMANEVRSYIPSSGLLGVGANLISSTQKDIYDDFYGYLANRLPGVNTMLPEQIDYWTGDPVKEYTDPMLRIFNALSPIKVSEGEEPWRKWLLESGFNSTEAFSKDSTGAIDFTPEQRQVIAKYVGEQQLWKKIEKMSTNDRYNRELEDLRAHRQSGMDSDEIKLKESNLSVYRELRRIVKQAVSVAELKALQNGDINLDTVEGSYIANQYLKMGDIEGAVRIQQKYLNKK